MGRTTPSLGAPPPSERKDVRAKRAKQTVNKDIPALLQAYPRAKHGIEASELIVEPSSRLAKFEQKPVKPDAHTDHDEKKLMNNETDCVGDKSVNNTTPKPIAAAIRLQVSDTLEAAAELHRANKVRTSKASRIAILNMASPLRPGGGFLNGARSQEESLCMRTTLYTSLKEEFYRLPEVGAVYTPDVLVFRSSDADATDLPKNERFFVDVITAAMHRMPDVEEDEEGERRYAVDKDRELTEQKMRAVVGIAKSKGVKQLVLGAWGCGAYGNPVNEIARAWKRVLLGVEQDRLSTKRKQTLSGPNAIGGMEVVFAVKEKRMAELFVQSFGNDIAADLSVDDDTAENSEGGQDEIQDTELNNKIAEIEAQIATARSNVLKDRLQSVLERLRISE